MCDLPCKSSGIDDRKVFIYVGGTDGACVIRNKQPAVMAQCYNTSWTSYSIDNCSPPGPPSPLSLSKPPSSASNNAAIIIGIIIGVLMIGIILALALRFFYLNVASRRQSPPVPVPEIQYELNALDAPGELGDADAPRELGAQGLPVEIGRNSAFLGVAELATSRGEGGEGLGNVHRRSRSNE
jgi:hypothetical protein